MLIYVRIISFVVYRSKLHQDIKKATATIEELKSNSRTEEALNNRKLQLLKQDLVLKEMEALTTAQELDRMTDRAGRLESALQTAMIDITRKTEAAEKWEFKSGEQQQQLAELEKYVFYHSWWLCFVI